MNPDRVSPDRYSALVTDLATLTEARRTAVDGALRAHTEADAAGAEEVTLATRALHSAQLAARAAAERVTATETRADRLWQELRALLGRRGRRLGDRPEASLTASPDAPTADPTPPGASRSAATASGATTPGATGWGAVASGGVATGATAVGDAPAGDIDAVLDVAAETIARAARGEPIAPVPVWTLPVLPLVGALTALAVVLPIRWALWVAGARLTSMDLLAEILIFLAPFAGIPAVTWWTRRHYGSRPDTGALGLTALGGMIASCGVVMLLR